MHPDAERNSEATARLRAATEQLAPGDLGRSLGGGWTVAMALGHLAFWDARQSEVLRHLAATGVLLDSEAPAPHNPDDLTNAALEPLLAALEPGAAGALALAAAANVDAVVASLDEPALAMLLAGEHAYLVRRWAHREEHLEQIARGG